MDDNRKWQNTYSKNNSTQNSKHILKTSHNTWTTWIRSTRDNCRRRSNTVCAMFLNTKQSKIKNVNRFEPLQKHTSHKSLFHFTRVSRCCDRVRMSNWFAWNEEMPNNHFNSNLPSNCVSPFILRLLSTLNLINFQIFLFFAEWWSTMEKFIVKKKIATRKKIPFENFTAIIIVSNQNSWSTFDFSSIRWRVHIH